MTNFLDPAYTPPVRQATQPQDRVVQIGDKSYSIIDGDTIQELSDGKAVGDRLRITGIQAPEKSRPDYDEGDTGLEFGERGGDESTQILYELLRDESSNLDLLDVGEQTVGAGAGARRQINLINRETGQDISSFMHEKGLADPSMWTTRDDYDASRMGRLERSILGGDEDGYQHLRDLKPDTIRSDGFSPFKSLALNEAFYDPTFHTGVTWRNHDRTIEGGFSRNPVSQAWSTGWTNAAADAGAFVNLLGETVDSEWLKDTGDSMRLRQQQFLRDNPNFRVQNLSDISTESFSDTVFDSLEWIGVNGTMSIPYLTAIAAPSLLAAPFTGGGSLVAGTAALTPAFALHAGTTWNQVDPAKRSKEAAGKTFAAAVGMTALDRFGFAKLFKPAEMLTKEGRDKAIGLIAKDLQKANPKLSGPEAARQARTQFNTAVREESIKFLKDYGSKAATNVRKASFIKNALAGFANAAPYEAVTEVGQEVTSYLTASHINGEAPDIDHLMDIIANSAAAGFLIGGGIGSVGTTVTTARDLRISKELTTDFDPTTLNPYEKVFYDFEQEADPKARTIDGQIEATKAGRKILEERDPDAASRDAGLFNKLAISGKSAPRIKDLFRTDATGLEGVDDSGFRFPSPLEAFHTTGYYLGKLVRAPLRSEVSADDIRHNRALMTLFGRLDFHGAAGRNFEARRDALSGTFDAVANSKDTLRLFGISEGRGNSAKIMDLSNTARKFGTSGSFDILKRKDFDASRLTDQEVATISQKMGISGITRDQIQALATMGRRLENASNAMFETELQALIKDYGADSKIVSDFKNSRLDGWWYKHNKINPAKVEADRDGFIKMFEARKKELLNDPNISQEDKDRIRKMNGHTVANAIVQGRGDVFEDFSLVGGTKWADSHRHRRLMNLTEIPGFNEQFGEQNIFRTFRQAAQDVSKRVAHLEYFGDGGRDLDLLFRQAIEIEKNNGLSDAEAKKKISRIAATYKDVIDSASNNYNPIKSQRIAKMQRFLLSYTAMVGLTLSMPASFPEFGTVLLDVGSVPDARQALWESTKEIRKGIVRGMAQEGKDIANAVSTSPIIFKQMDDSMFRTLQKIGVPAEISDIYQKWGIEGGEPLGEFWQGIQGKYFKYIGIYGVTQVQRYMNASFGVDFARTNLSILLNQEPGKPMTRQQGEAYTKLRALGMDVQGMVDALKRQASVSGSEFDRKLLEIDVAEVDPNNPGAAIEAVRRRGLNSEADLKYIDEQMSVMLQNFVNQRIQNPGAANRPLLFQDPHFALVTQFNGFLATVTTTIVPKLWQDQLGQSLRKFDPTLSYNAFTTIVVMMGLAFVGQWLREYLKTGEENPLEEPYKEGDRDLGQLFKRTMLASGIFGQFERPINWVFPSQWQQGEGLGYRVGSEFGGPALRHAENIISGVGKAVGGTREAPSGGTYEVGPDVGGAVNDFLKSVPLIAPFPGSRRNISRGIPEGESFSILGHGHYKDN